MKKNIFRAKRTFDGQIIEGQLLWIGNNPHIFQDNDLEEDGHHIIQMSDLPTWVEEDSIEPVVD